MGSCNMVSHRNFNAYMNEPFNFESAKLRLDGIYFVLDFKSKIENAPILFYLYSDGSTHSVFGLNVSNVPDDKFWIDPENYLHNLRMNAVGNSPGHFFIRKDRILIQVFDINPGALFPNNSIEFTGRIINDSKFILTKSTCKWCFKSRRNYSKMGFADYNTEYLFYKTNIKPDSSAIWFKERNWYKEKLWDARLDN